MPAAEAAALAVNNGAEANGTILLRAKGRRLGERAERLRLR